MAFIDKKTVRREETEARVEAWQKLSFKQQLEELDRRGHVAKRQRTRIEDKLARQTAAQQPAKPPRDTQEAVKGTSSTEPV